MSGLRFALAHARKYRKQRIIFVSPLLSILDQNAALIRKYIQDDSRILEHHSNIIRTKEDEQQLDEMELLMETWQSPLIITTLVQLLNTLFSGKTSAIRRFHSLCGSVIVIDEVQTVPRKMLSLFSLAVNFLSEICGATVVLCSATQPCTEQMDHPMRVPVFNVVPYDEKIWSVFKRTNIEDIGTMSLEQIRDFALSKLEELDSLLIVCNTKNEEKKLYKLIKDRNYEPFALSADMCVAHRRATLDMLREALRQKTRKTVCVSTQVVEAGVDISFACVIRLNAGMDSVVQAAGRCNRSGEAGAGVLAPVYMVRCMNERLGYLPEIERGQSATTQLLADFKNFPDLYGGALDSDEAMAYYYRALYKMEKSYNVNYHDFQVKGKPTIFSLLSENERYADDQPYYFRQAFKLAGSLFQVFEDNSVDVIVPYGRGEEIIAELCGERAQHDPKYLRELLDEAKQFSISLYNNQIANLNKVHGLIPLAGEALGLNGHYNAEYGFSIEEDNMDFFGGDLMQHPNIVEFKVTGDYALFSDPIMRVGGEKCSYQIPTYEALKGILSSVYWKPTLIWYIDQVKVINQIQTEVKGVRPIRYHDDKNELSYYTYLKDCCYYVRAHFEWNENRPELARDRNENKHHNIAKRMIEKGGRRDIFLGTRECQGYVEPCVFDEGTSHYEAVNELSFGLMYHGITYADEAYSPETRDKMTARFWRPVMKNGVITFPRPEECIITKPLRDMKMKPFGEQLGNFSGLREFGEVL